MALILNTNIASLNATRNLANTQSAQDVTFKRLSTGLRINSAKDDAAGLYLAQSQTKDIRGLAMATRNAGDGISMAQTAEGALDQIGQNLQRINELAIQSANGTYNDAAREGLQKEVDELSQEIFRIVETTEFNGMKLLNQQADNTDLQISFTNENSSRVNVGIPKMGLMQQQGQKIENDAQAEMFGLPKGYQLPDLMQFGSGDLAHGNALAKILGVEPNVPAAYKQFATDDNLNNYDTLFGKKVVAAGVATSQPEFDANGNVVPNADFIKNFAHAFVSDYKHYAADGTDHANANYPTIGDITDKGVTGVAIKSDVANRHQAPEFWDDKVFTITKDFIANGGVLGNALTTPPSRDDDGFSLTDRLVEAGIPGIVDAKNADGANTDEIQRDAANSVITQITSLNTMLTTAAGATGSDIPSIDGRKIEKFDDLELADLHALKDAYTAHKVSGDYKDPVTGALLDPNYNGSADSPVAMFSVADGLNQSKSINISNVADARMAITQTREAINAVSELRATFGAVMNRFEAVISGNNIYEENLTQARSRIQDTDFAKETANLAKQQVLQQAGISSLSQANQAGQVILNLL